MRGIILSVLLIATAVWSAPVKVVLQDGLNSYQGTEDSHIKDDSKGSNYGTSKELLVLNEKCEE